MKLTPRQIEVIRLMADGWAMGVPSTRGGGVRLQKGWLGMGGEVKSVHTNVFNSLGLRGLIMKKRYGPPESLWVLTTQGQREAELRKVEP